MRHNKEMKISTDDTIQHAKILWDTPPTYKGKTKEKVHEIIDKAKPIAEKSLIEISDLAIEIGAPHGKALVHKVVEAYSPAKSLVNPITDCIVGQAINSTKRIVPNIVHKSVESTAFFSKLIADQSINSTIDVSRSAIKQL